MLFDKLSNKTSSNRKADVVTVINNNKIDFNIAIQLSHSMIATGVSEGQNLTQLAIAIGDRILAFATAILVMAWNYSNSVWRDWMMPVSIHSPQIRSGYFCV